MSRGGIRPHLGKAGTPGLKGFNGDGTVVVEKFEGGEDGFEINLAGFEGEGSFCIELSFA